MFWSTELAKVLILSTNPPKSGDWVFCGPSHILHSLTPGHSGSSSQDKKDNKSWTKPIMSPAISTIPKRALIGAIITLKALLINPVSFPINPPTIFSIAHKGVLINRSMIASKNWPIIFKRFLIILLNRHAIKSFTVSIVSLRLLLCSGNNKK